MSEGQTGMNEINGMNEAKAGLEKKGSPYGVFMWGALLMAVVCFGLSAERVMAKRPARADAYTIAGILGLLSAAAAWSLGSAHERSRRSQQGLQGALEKLQDSMRELPRALMEDSVKVAEKERSERRGDQERQAGELRQALEAGLRTGFAPLAPALSERIEASLGSLANSLRQDREERSESLREMADTLSKLQGFQKEWAQSSQALLEKLREQGEGLKREISERDTGWHTGLQKLTEASRVHLEKSGEILLEGLRSARESLNSMSVETSDKVRAAASEAGTWLQSLSEAAEKMQAAAKDAGRVGEESSATQSGFKTSVETLNQGLTGMLEKLQSFASLAQGHEALLEKMEATLRRFEERSVELLEDNALKIQESFLDALEKAEGET